VSRQHGPDARLARRAVKECEACQGNGWVKGIFHQMECASCDGGGLVDRASGEKLEAQELILLLRMRLNRAMQIVRLYEQTQPAGPAADYGGRDNKHHRGGGNWTGD
jgi:excinuclease UvrABC ATPase subunit